MTDNDLYTSTPYQPAAAETPVESAKGNGDDGSGRQRQEPKTDGLIWYGDEPPTPPSYLVDETLPEIGVGILGGQFGAAKTFVGSDLAAAAIVGGEFAGKLVKRTGGVLWFAPKARRKLKPASMRPSTLTAAMRHVLSPSPAKPDRFRA
jgi:hypothetical protein